jgi:pentatricopeptide repeat protein
MSFYNLFEQIQNLVKNGDTKKAKEVFAEAEISGLFRMPANLSENLRQEWEEGASVFKESIQAVLMDQRSPRMR